MLYPKGSMPESIPIKATVTFKRFYNGKIEKEVIAFDLSRMPDDERSYFDIFVDEIARTIVSVDSVERIVNKGMYRKSHINFVEWFVGLSNNDFMVVIFDHEEKEEDLYTINEQFTMYLRQRINHYLTLSEDPIDEDF